MRIVLTAFIFLSVFFLASAQKNDSSSVQYEGCFEDMKTLFAERGVYELKDGVHTSVVTIRLNGECKIYNGRTTIEDGKIIFPVFIVTETGECVTLKSTGRKINNNVDAYNKPLDNTPVNGCSSTYITDDKEWIDIFIVDVLKTEEK